MNQHKIGLSVDIVAQLALLSAAALWGAGFFVTKIGVQLADPFAFIALRFGAGALFLGIVLRRSIARLTRREIVSGLIVVMVSFC